MPTLVLWVEWMRLFSHRPSSSESIPKSKSSVIWSRIVFRCPLLVPGVALPQCLLVDAHMQSTSREILLWMTPSEAPKALQASECSELLDPTRANCWISAQHQPGKFTKEWPEAVPSKAAVLQGCFRFLCRKPCKFICVKSLPSGQH